MSSVEALSLTCWQPGNAFSASAVASPPSLRSARKQSSDYRASPQYLLDRPVWTGPRATTTDVLCGWHVYLCEGQDVDATSSIIELTPTTSSGRRLDRKQAPDSLRFALPNCDLLRRHSAHQIEPARLAGASVQPRTASEYKI
jgi:hypothetical protein